MGVGVAGLELGVRTFDVALFAGVGALGRRDRWGFVRHVGGPRRGNEVNLTPKPEVPRSA